jgi:glycosyltransferase involved in cell wall biosynthesis
MQCLWLTWIDPWPEHDGQRIYSGRLIEALAAAGAELDILCFGHQGSRRTDGCIEGGVRWHLVPQEKHRPWRSVFSNLPHVAHRTAAPSMRERLHALLEAKKWDRIIFDGLSAGWALEPCLAHYAARARRPRLVHISHNHEESTRAAVARNLAGNPLSRRIIRRDAEKAAALERRLVDRANLVTAITPEDAAAYAARARRTPVTVLQPGYAGRKTDKRRIGPETPRRVVLAGSFDWIAKQMNLREFLAVAGPLAAARGVELQIVGGGNETFLEEMRQKYPAADITGRVADIAPYFDRARIAIVPERSGGGFKLKVLDYVFNRVPVAALRGAVAGMPLDPGKGILLFDNHKALARGVLTVIDDFDLLNNLQESAFAACADAFNWRCRGQALFSAIAALESFRDDRAA